MDRITIALAAALFVTPAAASAQQPVPLRETVTIVTDVHQPPMTNTPDEEFQRLDAVGDAIAVIEIVSLPAELTPHDGAPGIKVRGIVKENVKVSNRAALSATDGTVELEFGGDVPYTGEYPILKTGERYLIFFHLHPFMTRWYPVLPFRIDDAGRLEQVKIVQREPFDWKSPINGLPLDEVIRKLRKN
jgi:hypothetical protein